MICDEKGVLKGSEYFFFTKADSYSEYFYYMLVCGHFICNDSYSIKRNSHLGPLLMLIDDGEMSVTYGGSEQIARKNDIVLLNCDYPHAYHSVGHSEFFFMHIGGSYCRKLTDSLIERNDGFVFHSSCHREIRDIMEPLISKMYFVEHVPESEQSIAIYRILRIMSDSFSSSDYGTSEAKEAIESVLMNMRSHPEHNFTIDELANIANMSSFYFAHIFKEATGTSPIAYMSNLKIELAKNMLLYTGNQISQIGEQLGYSSTSSFINAFKSRVGTSPASYRKNPEADT